MKMKFDKFHNKSFLFSILSNKDHLPKANGYLKEIMQSLLFIIRAYSGFIDNSVTFTEGGINE
jgi:hypothetical protein